MRQGESQRRADEGGTELRQSDDFLADDRRAADQRPDPALVRQPSEEEVLRELLGAVRRATTRLDSSSPWKTACRQIGSEIARSLPGPALQLVRHGELQPTSRRGRASSRGCP